MVLRLARAPVRRKRRQQLNLPPEKKSAAVLPLDAVRQFIIAREAEGYELEDMEERFEQ